MKWWPLGRAGIPLLMVVIISLYGSACALLEQGSPGQDGEQASGRFKPSSASKEQASGTPASPMVNADKRDVKAQAKHDEKSLTESQKEWEEKIVLSPWLVSNEYFRQREPSGIFDLDLGRLFGLSKEDEQKRKSLEERIAKLEAEVSGGATSPRGSAVENVRSPSSDANGQTPLNRIAMVAFEPESSHPKGFGRIPVEIVASVLGKEPRLIVVEPPLVDRVLQDQQIHPTSGNAKQVARLMERDLGTQLVIFLHEASVSADWDRRGQVHAEVALKGEIHEGVSGEVLSLLSAKGTRIASGSQEALARVEALKQAADQLSVAIRQKAFEYEWSARVLSVEEGRVRLNAGRRSGLKEGDLLQVFRSSGQEVYHPTTKLLVGLDLGDPKGKVQVIDFFGADAAIAKITEGAGLAANDLLKLEKR